jgi:hypothetical protein
LIYCIVFIVEIYKLKIKNNEWAYCYRKNIIYSYSDLLISDKKHLNISDFFILIFLVYTFYLILIIQILITFIFILTPLKVCKKGRIFNILVYIPFLNSIILKNLYQMFIRVLYKNKTFYKLLFLNLLHLYIWGFPRLSFNYAFISIKILKSYEMNPDFRGLSTWNEIIIFIYQETYGELIERIEKNYKYPIQWDPTD